MDMSTLVKTKRIQLGEIKLDKVNKEIAQVDNKTRRYVLPCLVDYGEEFVSYLNPVFKVAAGVGDIIVDEAGLKHEKHVFLLLDTKATPIQFNRFLLWIREQPMYEDDYVYDNIVKSKYHMVVIQLPIQHYEKFDLFKLGRYSQMYSTEEINKFFSNRPKVKAVLIKDHNYKLTFTKMVNKRFGLEGTHQIDSSDPEWMPEELDFKPEDAEEIFNHYLKH